LEEPPSGKPLPKVKSGGSDRERPELWSSFEISPPLYLKGKGVPLRFKVPTGEGDRTVNAFLGEKGKTTAPKEGPLGGEGEGADGCFVGQGRRMKSDQVGGNCYSGRKCWVRNRRPSTLFGGRFGASSPSCLPEWSVWGRGKIGKKKREEPSAGFPLKKRSALGERGPGCFLTPESKGNQGDHGKTFSGTELKKTPK